MKTYTCIGAYDSVDNEVDEKLYILIDKGSGLIKQYKTTDLTNDLNTQKLKVDNIKLNENNKIEYNETIGHKYDSVIKGYLDRAAMIGLTMYKIQIDELTVLDDEFGSYGDLPKHWKERDCFDKSVYFIELQSGVGMILVPDNITVIGMIETILDECKCLGRVVKSIKVIGGYGLKIANAMCLHTRIIREINLEELDSPYLLCGAYMFQYAGDGTGIIIFPKKKFKSVIDTQGMFEFYKGNNIVLDWLSESPIVNASRMFYGCTASKLPTTSLKLDKLTSSYQMFGEMNILTIDLRGTGFSVDNNPIRNLVTYLSEYASLSDEQTQIRFLIDKHGGEK